MIIYIIIIILEINWTFLKNHQKNMEKFDKTHQHNSKPLVLVQIDMNA